MRFTKLSSNAFHATTPLEEGIKSLNNILQNFALETC